MLQNKPQLHRQSYLEISQLLKDLCVGRKMEDVWRSFLFHLPFAWTSALTEIHQSYSISTQAVLWVVTAQTPGFYIHFQAIICKCFKSQLGCIVLFQRYFSLGRCDQKCIISRFLFSMGILKMFILHENIPELFLNLSPPNSAQQGCQSCLLSSLLHIKSISISLDLHLCP